MARPVWKGSISFGLVNVPVQLFSAVRDQSIHFHLLSEDGHCRLRRKLYCPETKKEYDFSETARGFEIAPDQYVLIEKDELEKLKPEAGKTIEIEDFVELTEIDPVYFDRPYLLAPAERAEKPYELLRQAMEKSGKAAIARFVMRTKEYLAVIRPMGEHLGLVTMRFEDEVILEEVTANKGIKKVTIHAKELAIADKLIDQMTKPFKPEAYQDDYRMKVQQLIDSKAKGATVKLDSPSSEKPQGEVIDLMEALKKSLNQKRSARKSKTTKAAASRKKSS